MKTLILAFVMSSFLIACSDKPASFNEGSKLNALEQNASAGPRIVDEPVEPNWSEPSDDPFIKDDFDNSLFEDLRVTRSTYEGEDGCYVACYSHNKKGSLYGVGNNIFVHGLFRVKGEYEGRICQPAGSADEDISAMITFNRQCAEVFPDVCQGLECWVGGDTGGFDLDAVYTDEPEFFDDCGTEDRK